MKFKTSYIKPQMNLHTVNVEDNICSTSNYNLIDTQTPGALIHTWEDEIIIEKDFQMQ